MSQGVPKYVVHKYRYLKTEIGAIDYLSLKHFDISHHLVFYNIVLVYTTHKESQISPDILVVITVREVSET